MESKGDKVKFRLYSKYPIYGASRLGINKLGGDSYELTDHIGNVRVVVEDDNTAGDNLIGRTDYYPFGMPMPDRNVEGNYRYAYQGQEKDPETGKEAFELRLWDGRIGRWLTTDPYGEFHSPYLGMGNNPISLTDPDGGMTEGGCPEPCNGNKGFGGDPLGSLGTTPISGELGGLGGNTLFPNTTGVQPLSEVIVTGSSRNSDFKRYFSGGSILSRTTQGYLNTIPTAFPEQKFADLSDLASINDRFKSLERLSKYKAVTSGISKGFAGLSVGTDLALYATGQQSGARTTYHIGATGVAVGVGYAISAPASILVTGGFYAGEYAYDGITAQRAYNVQNKNSQAHTNKHGERVNSGKDLNAASLEYYLSNGGF